MTTGFSAEDIKIRPARLSDCLAVYELVAEMQEREMDKGAFERIFSNLLSRENQFIWVAESAGGVIGMACMCLHAQLHHSRWVAELTELAVNSAFRSRGVGKMLFHTALEGARAAGAEIFELSTHQRRKHAHAFYAREGMTPTHFKFTLPL